MMSIKIICSIVIIGCSTILGFRAANRYVQRVKEIRMLQMAFAQLESEITGYSTFLPEAVSGISTAVRGGVRNLFSDFAGRLQNKTGDSVAEAWQESLEKCQELLNLYPEEIQILAAFGGVLGSGDKESQRRYFSIVQNQLKKQEIKAEEACLKYQNMCRSLGLLGGLAISILLF